MSLGSIRMLGRRTKRLDLKPVNSILSAVVTAWDLDVSRRAAAKDGEKGAGRKEGQTNREPRLVTIT
jgi:hypothetical protein